MATAHASKDTASLADFLQILRLRKALIVLLLALVVITVLVVTALLPRWYLTTTKVRVEKPEGVVKLFQAQSSNSYCWWQQWRRCPGYWRRHWSVARLSWLA